jgi:hypothetical protein
VLNKAVKAQIPFHTLLLAYANVKAFGQLRGRRPLALMCRRFFGNFFRPRPSN